MPNHQQLLAEALSAIEDRWAHIEDATGRSSAVYAVIFKLVSRSIVGALALDTAFGRLRIANYTTDPWFLKMLSTEAHSDLARRLEALDESPANPRNWPGRV